MASKIGVSRQVLEKWENDEASPDISVVISLSDILEVSTDELLGRETINPEVVEEDEKIGDSVHVELNEDGEVNLNLNGLEKQKTHHKFLTLFQAMEGGLFLLALVAYIIMGVFWTDQNMGWKMGWLTFFIPIIIVSIVDVIITHKLHHFAYPFAVIFTYLLLGFLGGYLGFNGWGVYWFLFITIPAFYAIVSPIDHYLGKK